jgi:chromosome segregation ATPase
VIHQKAEQIKTLTQELEQHRQQMEVLKKEIGDATVRMETTRQNFQATYNQVLSQVQADIENMKKYLK